MEGAAWCAVVGGQPRLALNGLHSEERLTAKRWLMFAPGSSPERRLQLVEMDLRLRCRLTVFCGH